MAKRKTGFTVSDGKMVLTLEPAEEGGYIVTSPLDPGILTEADTLEEAFEMAYDVAEGLREARAKLHRTNEPTKPLKNGGLRKKIKDHRIPMN